MGVVAKKELNELINNLLDDSNTLSKFFFVKSDDSSNKLYFANMESTLLKNSIEELKNCLKNKIINQDLEIVDFLTEDERQKAIYSYPEGVKKLGKLEKILPQLDKKNTNYNNKELDDIELFIFYIKNNNSYVVTFKIIYPIQVLKKSSMIHFDENQLKQAKDNYFRYTYDFDFFICNGILYILDLSKFEKFFSLKNIIKNESEKLLNVIDKRNYFNVDEKNNFKEYVKNDIKLAKKLLKAKNNINESFDGISIKTIAKHVSKNQAYKDLIKIEDEKTFLVKTKEDALNIIKLFNEDRWVSELTKNIYDSIAKNKVK